MFDFDLQYLAIWFLIIPALQVHDGKVKTFSGVNVFAKCLCGFVMLVCVWFGIGDACYFWGLNDACRVVTPFYTLAQVNYLTDITDQTLLEDTADKIIKLNPSSSIAYSAKSNVCFSGGNITGMIENKEKAISLNKYSLEEYCDYFEKLYVAMQLYAKQNDATSVEYCKNKLLAIPNMLQEVENSTSTLAWLISAKPELTLPDEYLEVLSSLG
jgi:hypothetical protein